MRFPSFRFLHYRKIVNAVMDVHSAQPLDYYTPRVSQQKQTACWVLTDLGIHSQRQEAIWVTTCSKCQELFLALRLANIASPRAAIERAEMTCPRFMLDK